jgi:prephenate dehydrogenase
MQQSPEPWPRRVAVLGVGLLGGSVGLALRRKVPAVEIVGTSRNASRRDLAIACGAVHHAVDSIHDACQDADVVVVASPVDRIAEMVIEAAESTSADCLITDVGSTKAGIVDAVSRHSQAQTKFVAAHPIAGSEKTGVQHASESLFDGRLIIVTPGGGETAESIGRAERFWALTGGQTLRMSPQQHDTHLASVSHVPHLVSALVARLASPSARRLIGSGWRDVTRVAAGDPSMWTAITSENRSAISGELRRFAEEVDGLRQMIDSASDEDLFRWLAEAKQIKDETH